MSETYEKLIKRIMVLNERVWEGRVPKAKIDQWLENFTGKVTYPETERLHALFWLSQFMYFGSREIRVLLKSLYRDLFLYPTIQDLRATLGAAATETDLSTAIKDELRNTRFFGVGNPSESGVHLLYYFRQENRLGKENFMDAVQIFTRVHTGGEFDKRVLRTPGIKRYVFIDDICGSGDTAGEYSELVLRELLRLNPMAKIAYYSLFATAEGLKNVRKKTLFGQNCAAVYELDSSYRCLSDTSRYFNTKEYPDINPEIARRIVIEYGNLLDPRYASGYKNSQMLMGFHHNTPDNTLGIIWHDDVVHGGSHWTPIFKRYPKFLGERV